MKNLQPRLLCQARLSFKIENGLKNLPDKKRLKDFVTSITRNVKGPSFKEEKRKQKTREHS